MESRRGFFVAHFFVFPGSNALGDGGVLVLKDRAERTKNTKQN